MGKPLNNLFKRLSTNNKLDFEKLKQYLIEEFEDFGIAIF